MLDYIDFTSLPTRPEPAILPKTPTRLIVNDLLEEIPFMHENNEEEDRNFVIENLVSYYISTS